MLYEKLNAFQDELEVYLQPVFEQVVKPFTRKYRDLLSHVFNPYLRGQLNLLVENVSLFNSTYLKCSQNETCLKATSTALRLLEAAEAALRLKVPPLGDLTFGFTQRHYFSGAVSFKPF
jgi:hypothetical protein